jgi:Asp-tRNA(Asn)/Glu-tRNA(Gln) amidotransferase A subunit family amidase
VAFHSIRFTLNDWTACFGGNTNVRLVLGPMARSVEDLILASRVLLGKTDMIGAVPPVPYREVKLPEKLKFGFYTDGVS